MGYTHYWRMQRDYTPAEWTKIQKAARNIMHKARNSYMIALAWEYDEPDRKPELSDSVIRFNGVLDDGHETFAFTREMGEEPEWRKGEGHFAFCKTARKDYDPVVVAILTAAKEIAPDALTWSSDGYGIAANGDETYNDLGDGLQLYNEACNGKLETPNAEVE